MALGKNIETIMLEKGLNIAKLSEKSGVEYGALYSLIKRDSKSSNSDNIKKIATALEVPINDILDTKYEFKDVPSGKITNLDATKQYLDIKTARKKLNSNFDRMDSTGKKKLVEYSDDIFDKYQKNKDSEE